MRVPAASIMDCVIAFCPRPLCSTTGQLQLQRSLLENLADPRPGSGTQPGGGSDSFRRSRSCASHRSRVILTTPARLLTERTGKKEWGHFAVPPIRENCAAETWPSRTTSVPVPHWHNDRVVSPAPTLLRLPETMENQKVGMGFRPAPYLAGRGALQQGAGKGGSCRTQGGRTQKTGLTLSLLLSWRRSNCNHTLFAIIGHVIPKEGLDADIYQIRGPVRIAELSSKSGAGHQRHWGR